MTTAQHLADQAVNDFGHAMRSAAASGTKRAAWFGGFEYAFDDGSVLVLRYGKVEQPTPSPVTWTQAERIRFDC